MNKSLFNQLSGLAVLLLLPHFAHAQQVTYTENFNGATLSDTTKTWSSINGACLTASTSNAGTTSAPAAGVIPGCVSASGFTVAHSNYYYNKAGSILVGGTSGAALPDPVNYGVLRITNGASSAFSTGTTNGNNETGAFILGNPFPGNSGMNITYTTYTWGGNGYQNSSSVASGADGISFFLLDASKYVPSTTTLSTTSVVPVTKTGAYGGSLGYDCSFGKYGASASDSSSGDGIIGAYLGIGIDEFGNYVNQGDNGNSSQIAYPASPATAVELASPGQTPNTIGIRGGGNINTATFPTSGGLPISPNPAVGPIAQPMYICKYGYYTTSATSSTTVTTATVTVSSSNPLLSLYTVTSATANAVVDDPTSTKNTGKSVITWVSAVAGNSKTYTTTTGTYPVKGVYDYPILGYTTLNSSKPIFSQEYVSSPSRLPVSTVTGSGATAIKYYINLTATGVLSVSYSYSGGVYTPVVSNKSILPAGSTTLPNWFLFGFASGTGGGSNNHEISCFSAAQPITGSGSAGSNIPQGQKVLAGNQIYIASYNPLYWTGTVQAEELSVNATTGAVTIDYTGTGSSATPVVVWDAGCELSGPGSCPSSSTPTITTPPTRAIAVWNDGIAAGASTATSTPGAIAFTPGNFSQLSGNEQQMLNCGTPNGAASTCDNYGTARIQYMINNNVSGTAGPTGANAFRSRISLLGDMINSSPLFVGAPLTLSYLNSFVDKLNPGTTQPEGTTYGTYQSGFNSLTNGGRLNTVYVGANDGMVHGFAAGYGDVISATATDNTGQEVMAYVPSLPLSTIHNIVSGGGELDYTNLLYAHNDYVDAPPGYGDLYWSGAVNSSPITTKWQTWLVGGLGGGGNLGGVIGGQAFVSADTISTTTLTGGVGEIYAINITNPLTPETITSGSGTTVAGNVMGDWTTNTIVCNTVVGISDTCNKHMGSTYGTPTIRRLHTGNWAIIFGNGLNSTDGTAGIFIIEITGGSANKPTYTIHYIDTGVGPSQDPTGQSNVNGIAYASPADLDGDNIFDYIYAGDMFGNVWRFDITSSTASNWGAPVKIYAASTSTQLQPITTSVIAATIPYNGQYGVVVNFGTGRELQQTLTSAAGYAPANQNLYGIWDWNMSSWNAKNSVQYYSQATAPTTNLVAQTLTAVTGAAIPGYTLSNNTVCYPFMVSCGGAKNTGWYVVLANTQEQFIYNPTLANGNLYINSVIPPNEQLQTATCTAQPASGYTYSLNAATGNFTGQAVYNLNGVGTPFFVTTTGTATGTNPISTLVTQTQNGTPVTQQLPCQTNCTATSASTRLTWVELR